MTFNKVKSQVSLLIRVP